ncbi:MAG: hypothetical protein U0Z53_12745 [Blastocatellia bacterium]
MNQISFQLNIQQMWRDLPESRSPGNRPARVNCAILANRATLTASRH